MQGKCLINLDNGGLILGENGRRYKFKNSSIKNFSSLKKNQQTKFLPKGNIATNIIGASRKEDNSAQDDLKPTRRPKGSNMAFVGMIFQFFLLIPYVGYIFYFIGLIITLQGFNHIAKEKKMYKSQDYLIKGFLSGIIVIICILSLFFYFGTDIFNISIFNMGNEVLMLFSVVFGLLFFNAIYSSYMIYKGMSRLGIAYRCELLKVSGILHPMFLLLLPFGLGIVVYYIYALLLSIAFIKMRIWE